VARRIRGHDAQSDYGFHPAITFRFSAAPPGIDGAPVIRWLLEAVQQHELEDADARRSRREEQILREWAATLRFRQHLDEGRHLPIPYQGYSIDGNRVSFSIPALPDGVVLDQPRMIRREQRIMLSGVVDDVAADRVVLWVEKGVAELPPERGQLAIDDHASRIALDRQKGALDAVRYGRCLRPALRTLILDPSQSRAPLPVQVEGLKWIQPELDDDKKVAVSKALGAEDILVVHGPPGTGTVFITELVGQLLERNPGCKILLTSQTHVALDNALEGCHAARPAARLLRVAQRDDDRVSTKVQELTIDRVADRWRSDLANASEEFLASAAAEMGVRRDDIALGIAVGRLRVESAELDRIVAQLDEREKILASVEQKLAEAQVGRIADDYPETSEEIDELREQVRELRENKKTVGARLRKAAADLAATGELSAQLAKRAPSILLSGNRDSLQGSSADRKFHELLRLAEEWQLRFGRSREFNAAMIADSSLVAGTCLGFSRVPGMLAAEFDVCIVDEASKATPTELLVPLSRARRWILVGDPKQLPPFVEDLAGRSGKAGSQS
jgi:AAA domain